MQEKLEKKLLASKQGLNCVFIKHEKQKLVYCKAAHENHNFTRVTRLTLLTCLSQTRTHGGELL